MTRPYKDVIDAVDPRTRYAIYETVAISCSYHLLRHLTMGEITLLPGDITMSNQVESACDWAADTSGKWSQR